MTVDEEIARALGAVVMTWGLRQPLEKATAGLVIAVLLPLRLLQNRCRIGVWDIRPTHVVVDEILAEDGGSS